MNKKIILFCVLFSFLIAGCATLPPTQSLPAYNLNGTTYYPLASLCNARNINWQYDTFTRAISLSKDTHKINLLVGDALVLVDGQPLHFNHPVDIYQGSVVVPSKFKEQVIDSLFREAYPARKAVLPLTKIKKIVVDAGHGGNDPGAIGRTGLREKDVNLDIAKRLSHLLRQEGIEVVMTRSTDSFIPLSTRVNIANNSRADLFISIHSNANRVRSLNGFEVYYVSPSVSDTKRASSAAKSEVLNLNSACLISHSQELKTILWDMIYTNARAESIELSRTLCRAMNNCLDTRILGIKGARFEVLRGVRMPGVLIEVGFLSNYNEERMLKNNYYREKIAKSILQGVRDYEQDFTIMEAVRR
jgi:N-acetylmuramoyl-L-alanine amidase